MLKIARYWSNIALSNFQQTIRQYQDRHNISLYKHLISDRQTVNQTGSQLHTYSSIIWSDESMVLTQDFHDGQTRPD